MNPKFFILLILLPFVSFTQETTTVIIDSIDFYLYNSKKKPSNSNQDRLVNALHAKRLSEKHMIDSLRVKSYISLSSIYFDTSNYELFLKNNHRALKLAKKINHRTSLAKINKNFGYYFFNISVDSAYYYDSKAEKIFRELKDNFNTAVVLLDIAILQKNDKDYTGSELTSINALSLLDKLDETNEVKKYKSYLYNNLGLVFKELSQFDESIKYNLKALDLKKQLNLSNTEKIDNQKNNLANAYKKSGQLDLALNLYNEILDNKNLLKLRPDVYAVVLDNYGNTLYLSDKKELLPGLYKEALRISDSIDYNGYNSIIINQHLAEYYHDNNQKDSAKYYGYRAKDISEQYHNDDLLKSLLLLSEIEEDSMASKHLKAYVKLSDSLQKNERSIRNKFARIRFETQQIEKENIEMTKQRMWLLIISVVIIIASFLLYLVITQRNKNRELQFIQKQQQTNEEIYNLMLSQNENIEEARTLEKKRISEELHDGVLGRLFGTRLSLDSLNMSNSPDAIKTRSQYIDELKTIEEDIRKVSHELNTDFVSGSGFIDIIKTLVETQTLAYNLTYTLDHDNSIHWDEITNKKKIHIYRIIQESLHNIYKHANATKVNISFTLKKNVICLTMTDNGSGFDVNKAKSGIGLKNMNSRIKEIDGTIQITSEKELGTTVTIQAPIS